jgi:hypothetical protein
MKGNEFGQVEKERAEFKQLILENPNYFGTVLDPALAEEFQPVYPMENNVKYEELKCVGLYPEDDLLEAIIEVKLPYGFKDDLCTPGSKEYVAFYVDYDDGAGFVSVGAPAEVNVHDILFVDGGHLFYAVRRPFTPKEYWECDTPQVVRVRAILSWEALPTGPNYVPVWGNVLDVWVQIKPERKGPMIVISGYALATAAEYEVTELPLEGTPVPFPPPEPTPDTLIMVGDQAEIKDLIKRSVAAEARIREEAKVEEERLEFKKLIMQNLNYFGSITKSKDKAEIMKTVYQLPPKTLEALMPQLAINPDLLVPVVPMLQKTQYEELRCVGLYPEDDLLEAVIEVKLPYGFNGDLCTLGSTEYVAFYVDWGTGVYVHVGTATVRVHDIPQVDDKHLFYAVKARIPDVDAELKHCSIENIVSVKAILSWDVDPTPYGDAWTPAWGNVLTRNVQIRPEGGPSVQCAIDIVNEVHVDDIAKIGSDKGLAIKIDASSHTVPGTYDRPLGGIIACWGNINVPDAAYYRFRYRRDALGTTWENVLDDRKIRTFLGFTSKRTPDGDGWFSKSDHDSDVANYSLTALVHWRSYGKNGPYLLRLELADVTKTVLPGQTYDIPILLDNTGIELLTFGGTPAPLPASGVVVKDSLGNYRKCDTFVGHEDIKIFGNFRDDYFKRYSLKVFGGNINVSGYGIGSGRYDDPPVFDAHGHLILNDRGIAGAVNGGPGKEIKTLDLCTVPQSPAQVKCAYGIELHVSDRAVVGYLSGYQFNTRSHGRDGFVTFDWEPTGC